MTELDTETLRRALRTRAGDAGHAGDAGGPLDVSAIISQGRGLRRRRTVMAVAGGACAVAAVLGIATGISHLAAQPAGSRQPALAPQPARHGTAPDRHAPAPSRFTTPTAVPTASPSGIASPTGSPSPTATGQNLPTPITSTSPSSSPTGGSAGATRTATSVTSSPAR